MAKRGNRQEEALRIRDAALAKMRADGGFEEIKGFGPVPKWQGGGLMMIHRTRFQKLPEPKDPRVRAMLRAMPEKMNMPYGLDIWDTNKGGKVLNIEWNEAGDTKLTSFRRGAWEAKVLSLE